jgi:uncharacterized protein YecT (DUF1311 family)
VTRPGVALRALALAVPLALPAVGAATAQPRPATPCSEQASTYEMSACLERALQAADRDLNAAYREAQSAIDRDCGVDAGCRAAWRTGLQRAQRAWIAFRNADCRELAPLEWRGGTGSGPAVLACLLASTEQRARDLTARYERR